MAFALAVFRVGAPLSSDHGDAVSVDACVDGDAGSNVALCHMGGGALRVSGGC